MRKTSTAARALSIVAGLAIAAVGGWLAISHAPTADAQALVVAMVAGAAFGAWMLPRLAGAGFWLALLGIVAAEGYGLAASIERLLAVRESQALEVRQAAEPRRIAADRVTEAKAKVTAAENAEAALRAKGKCVVMDNSKPCRALNALGQTADAARGRLTDAETALAALPVARAENRLADAIGWTPRAVDIALAGAAQTGLLALMLAFMGAGHGRKATPRRKAEGKAGAASPKAKRAPRKPRTAKQGPAHGRNVVPFPSLKAANAN